MGSSALQDGLLAHYMEQATASDVKVEARIEREPFDLRNILMSGSNAIKALSPDPSRPEPRPPIYSSGRVAGA
jgi:hypothetical protein